MTLKMKNLSFGEVRLFYNAEQVDDNLEADLAELLKKYNYELQGAGTSRENAVRVMVYKKKEIANA